MGGRGAGAAKVNETLQSTVFNCALNPALKKKKIPRVIPPLPNQVRCIVKLIYRVAHQVSDYRGVGICSSLVDRVSAVTLRVSQSQQRPHSAANHAT